jgi:hypothetical protein
VRAGPSGSRRSSNEVIRLVQPAPIARRTTGEVGKRTQRRCILTILGKAPPLGVGMIMRQQSLARLMTGWWVRMEQTLSWTCLTRSEAAGVRRSLCRHCHAQYMIREAEGGPGQFCSTCGKLKKTVKLTCPTSLHR